MYGARIQAVCEQEILSGRGYCGNSDPGFWRKREKWKKATGVRWPGTGRLLLLNSLAAVQNGDSLFVEKPAEGRSRFAATTGTPSIANAAKSRPRKATGTEANEVCPVPWTDTEGLMDQLPRKVSAGLVLESVGTLYEGPNEDKYWSQNRCGLRHPYPVGYTATKMYKGVQFKQTIEEGSDGPIFVVGELDKAPCSADSPAKAWSLALANSQLNSAIRVHGRKHFGFDCPIVLGCLSQMDKGPTISGKDSTVQKLLRNVIGGLEGHDDRVSKVSKDGLQFDSNERWSSAEQSRALSQDRVPNASPHNRSIRLRSVLVEDTLHQKAQILSCQDTKHPLTRGFFEGVMTSLSNEDDSPVTGTPITNEEFSPNGHRTSKSNTSSPSGIVLKQGVSALDTSLDSILRRMDEVARNDGRGSRRDNGSWKHENSEKMTNGRDAEQEILKQNSPMGRFFSSSAPRARILSEDSTPKDSRRTAQTRSLANLLEEWHKGGKPQSVRNGKPQVGEGGGRNSQLLRRPTKVERMPLTREEKTESVSDTRVQTSSLDILNVDIQRKVEEWHSGKEGRSLVLKEIRRLVCNNCVNQALQILRKLHSNGARLDDEVYSALFPFTLDDWQKQAVRHVQEKSVLVSAPGGVGKFVVGTRCLYQAFVQGERSLLVTPYEAMAREHWKQLQILFGGKNVGCVISKEEDQLSHVPITVITLETLVKELREGRYSSGSSVGNSFSEGLSLVVMDRFHTRGDANYGSLWEEAIMFLDRKVKLVALSLPTKTSNDIATWISTIHRPCELVVCESESVQKCKYFCDASGLHLLGNNDEKLLGDKSKGSLTVESDSVTDFTESLRHLFHSIQTEAFLPLAISFSSTEDCITATNIANEVITEEHISAEECACIEERVQHFFHENSNIERFVNKDDIECLSRGFGIFHDGQLPLWTEFVEGLVCDNLVSIVFGTSTVLCSSRISFRTVAICLTSGRSEAGKSSSSEREFTQLCGKAGRRGRDTCGNVVFIGGNPTWLRRAAVMDSDTTHSHFKPSYSLLLNLLSQHALPEVRHFMESNYGEYLVKNKFNEELKELEVQISDVKTQKEDLEAQLFQKLQKLNTSKLQDATIFTHVDVRVSTSEPYAADDVLPGVLCAVLPGPSKLLYGILCADNVFRLLLAGALDHVYTEEKPLDAVYKSSTGCTLQAPPFPLKEKWKLTPGDYLAYTSDGTTESARVVEALLNHGGKIRHREDEPNCREEIRSSNGLLSTLYRQQETILSRPTTTWTKSEKLIETLVKADAVELAPKDTRCATIKPLGVMISKLHNVENELWFTMALSSSIVKPLTAPELAAVCSALLFRSGGTDSASPDRELGSLNKTNIEQDTPRRLRVALEKLENLRKTVEQLQGSDSPVLRLDGSAVTAVHSLCRESQDPPDDLKSSTDGTVLLVKRIIKLLHDIDNVWGRSLHVLSALEGTTGLHNLARRAAQLLQKIVLLMQIRS